MTKVLFEQDVLAYIRSVLFLQQASL